MSPPEQKKAPLTLLFDLDDTCYRNPEIPAQIRANIHKYMGEKLGLGKDEIETVACTYYVDHGTTMAGLRASGIPLDYDDWHAEVHGALPYDRVLSRDDELRRILESLPHPKWIFTNGDERHAERCLACLGIRHCFEGVICFESIMRAADEAGLLSDSNPVVCKPSTAAFELALQQAGTEAGRTIFFDDSTRNVAGAHKLGITTVLVGGRDAECGAHVMVDSLHCLPSAMPSLWQPPMADMTEGEVPLEALTICTEVSVSAQ